MDNEYTMDSKKAMRETTKLKYHFLSDDDWRGGNAGSKGIPRGEERKQREQKQNKDLDENIKKQFGVDGIPMAKKQG